MSLPYRLTTEAQDDYNEAFAWYEARTPPKGDDFEQEVEAVYARLGANPLMHGRVYGDVRKAIVSGYPYLVLYIAEPAEVVVIAVHHTSRDPAVWQGRVQPPWCAVGYYMRFYDPDPRPLRVAHLRAGLRSAVRVVAVQVLYSGRSLDAFLVLDDLWDWLFDRRPGGLLHAGGEGFYHGEELILARK